MKKTLIAAVLALFCAASADAQKPATAAPVTKTISSTKLANVSEKQEVFESYALDASYEMLVKPLLADIDILGEPNAKGRIEHSIFRGTAHSSEDPNDSGRYYLILKTTRNNNRRESYREGESLSPEFQQLKSQVVFDFCRETGADLIVMPQFSARNVMVPQKDENGAIILDAEGKKLMVPKEVNGYYVMEVDMIGYPAVYKSFRPAEAGDYWIKNALKEKSVDNERKIKSESSIIEKK
ncbi:MAG: hypothetical protein J1E04_03605 [Alistipes sp.]|nr:hypothetical protein [Alistipes sp.]